MRKNRNKSVPSSNKPLSRQTVDGNEPSARLPSDYSQPTLRVKGAEKYFDSISFDVQVTIRATVTYTRKHLCMLTGLALSDVAEFGLGISDWMILEWLYTQLLGNKQTPYERKDQLEFELSLLLKIVLLSGTWMGLETKVKLPEDVQELILNSKYVPKGRTKASWKQSWNLDKFLEVQIVPLDVIMERSKGTIRYSSYTKGYGESSRMGRRQKTRPSAELDGEEVDLQKEQMMNLDLSRLSHLLSAVLLELKYTKKH